MTVIATSTAATATGFPNQRKVDRCSNGNIVTAHWDGSSSATTALDFFVSTDNGATFSVVNAVGFSGTVANYVPNFSFFIDLDDYIHIVYKDRNDGYIYYRRATPNAGRTGWTWSAALTIRALTTFDYPDIVAHREGTGWVAHIVYSRMVSAGNDRVQYSQVSIDASGVQTLSVDAAYVADAFYGNTNHKFPSIDFNHTGDGKTIAGGNPHLYVAWSAGAAGAGLGIRFKKATYAAGAWTWGAEREIDNTLYMDGAAYRSIQCLFDGTRVLIGGTFIGDRLWLWERDAADTTTTNRINSGHAASAFPGTLTYDQLGNVWLIGRDGGAAPFEIVAAKYNRSQNIVQWFQSGKTTTQAEPYLTAMRGFYGYKLHFIYTEGGASPFSIKYDSISLNNLPTKPTNLTGKWKDGQLQIGWTHNDPDGNPQSKSQVRYRKAVV